MDIKNLGQVFTPLWVVDKMINLISIKNPNLILEPCCGSGNFYNRLKEKFKNVVGIEIDNRITCKDAIIENYFKTKYTADVIITNPPYVDFKNIINKPKSDNLIHKPNLYLYFLEKMLDDLNNKGELIIIVPANVFVISSAKKLIEKIYNEYSITYFKLLDENIWDKVNVATAIVKIVKEKNNKNKIKYFYKNGKIFFGEKPKFDEKFVIKVGGVFGNNNALEKGNFGFVVSTTEKDKKLKYLKYEPNKWIRPVPLKPEKFSYQIFVNGRTRNLKPFYVLDFQKEKEFIYYDGAVLSIFVNCNKRKTLKIVDKLNKINWGKLGIKYDGRYIFSQSILDAILN